MKSLGFDSDYDFVTAALNGELGETYTFAASTAITQAVEMGRAEDDTFVADVLRQNIAELQTQDQV